VLNIYADESCKENHHYFVLGATMVSTSLATPILHLIKKERVAENIFKEMKWGKVSNNKLPAYLRMADLYFDLLENNEICFHALIADAHRFNHKKFNNGCGEIGYNKLLYQLLVKAADRLKEKAPFYVYLDDRTTKHSLDELREILNNGSRKLVGIEEPFRRVQFRDSKSCDLIQLNDLIIGAIGFMKNDHHTRPGASKAKLALAEHITRRAKVSSLTSSTRFSESRFRIWNFQLQE